MTGAGGFHGNLLLSRVAITSIVKADISIPLAEYRGAIIAEVARGPARFRAVATHLGLSPGARRRQAAGLLRELERIAPGEPAVVMGDFNDWLPIVGARRFLRRHFETPALPASFPAHRPILPLDQIWSRGGVMLSELRADTAPLARVASDHRPVVAEITVR